MNTITHHIPYGRQDISEEDIQAVVDVLRSDWLTQGPAILRFEDAVARYCGADHGIAFANATGALHIACLALGVGPGDYVWTTSNTFVASANCARYCGAEVDFVDINPTTYNISEEVLASKLKEADKKGTLPKVVIPVHFSGQSCDMSQIKALSSRYGFHIIEDASHAIGGRYENKPIGDCRYSDMTVFSFHPVKIITTGEGGMVMTNSEGLKNRLQRLRTHGITRDTRFMQSPPQGDWEYQQIELGYNYRMTDMQAALGYSQLTRIDDFIARRHVLAARYTALLADLPLVTPHLVSNAYSSFHLYVIRVKEEAKKSRRQAFDAMRSAGIGVNVHYIPVHLQPYYQQLGHKAGDCPNAEAYYADAITLPLHYKMSESQQDFVVSTLRKIFD